MVELKVFEENKAEVVVGDDIVSETVNDLSYALTEAAAKGCQEIDVNMDGVQYINSSGLSILVGAHSKLKTKGGRLRITHASQDLMEFFDSINLTQVFEITQ